MRATLENGQAIWLEDSKILGIVDMGQEAGCEILFQETVSDVTEYTVRENFETIVNQVDPLLVGETPEEIVGNLIGGVANVPLSLLRKVLPW